MFALPAGAGHDPAFIALVRQIITGLLKRVSADELFLIQIDNWFDHKWLDLSVRNPGSEPPLDQHTPIPMFNPSRVVHQARYLRGADPAKYSEVVRRKDVHGDDGVTRVKHRRFADLTNDGVFVWYSAGTSGNGRGSLMVVAYTRTLKFAWYASLVRRTTWAIDRAKGITPQEVRALAESVL
jgi:hypothetical protein